MVKYLKSGEISEEAIQKAVIQWVKYHPVLKRLVIHIPNEGKRTPRFGKKLKDLGMLPGVWDILIPMARHGYHGAWIEIKSKNGILSPEQVQFKDDMQQQNYFTAVCHSVDEGIKTIEDYCLH